MSEEFVINPAEIFLNLLDPEADKHLFACHDYKRKLPSRDHIYGSYSEVKDQLKTLNDEGYCVYVTVNRMAGHKRGKDNCTETRDVWVDDDDPKDEPRNDFPLAPSCIVETSPGKFQYHWATRTNDFDTFNKVMQTMVDDWGCDKNALGLARILRLPGYNHNKDLDHPFLSRIVGGNKKIYGWEEITKAFPPAKDVVKSNRDERGKFSKSAATESLMSGENYHDSLVSLALSYANKKLDTEEVIALLGRLMDGIPKGKRRDEWAARRSDQHLRECAESGVIKKQREDEAKKGNLDKFKDPMTELRRQYGVTEDDVKDIGEEKYVYEDLLIEGHILTLIGEAGSGKTALFVHLAPEFVKAGYTVNYINLDAPWNELPRLQQFAVDGGYTMLSPDVKKGGLTIEGLVEFIKQMSLLDNSLVGEIFIFDTLKRCVDMMSKGQLKEFYAMCRKLSARGATVVLLGHANKKRDHNGNLIFEGTGDVRNDTDELLFLECKDDVNENRFVSTYVDTNCGAKVRGKFKPMTFIIKKDRSVIKSLVYIDTKKAKKEELKIQKHRDLYDFLVSYVKNQPGKNQGEITEAAKEAGHPKKTARDLLVTLSDVDSDKQCLYSRVSKKHPYPLEYYTMEYAEGKMKNGEQL